MTLVAQGSCYSHLSTITDCITPIPQAILKLAVDGRIGRSQTLLKNTGTLFASVAQAILPNLAGTDGCKTGCILKRCGSPLLGTGTL
jgi:hypothetical protein